MRHAAAVTCLLVGAALALTACGGRSGDSTIAGDADTGGTALTIYASLPLKGDSRQRSLSIANAEQLALEQAGGRVGAFTIKLKVLNDADATTGKWEPGPTSANARKAAQDKTTIAYLGDSDSGATAVSIPILNEAKILSVSPSSTAVGLTRADGAGKGEPDKYYPSGKRSFGRVVPTDLVQAAAQVAYQQQNGCTALYVLNDKEVYGMSLASLVVATAKKRGLAVVGNEPIDPKAADYHALSDTIKAKGADCVFFAGITENNAVLLWQDVHAANPGVRLFGGDGLTEAAFTAKIGASAERVTYLTSPTLDPKLYPPAGQEFFTAYRDRFHAEPDPYAIFGYEAMSVVLLAVRNAGAKGNNHQAVIDAFFKIKNKPSVLGPYSIDENGDTTLRGYAGDRVVDGKVVFDKVLEPTS